MALKTVDQLQTLFRQRQRDTDLQMDHAMAHEMVRVYNNKLPAELEEYFAGRKRLKTNPVRSAWDDFVTLGALEMPPFVKPPSDDDAGNKKAEKIEGIAYGWHGAASRIGRGFSMEGFMQQIIWWLVGTAKAVGAMLPDHPNQTPFLYVIDPRKYFPPSGYKPWGQAPLDDVLIVERLPMWALKQKYKHIEGVEARLNAAFDLNSAWEGSENMLVEYAQFYSSEQWTVCTFGGRTPVEILNSVYGVDPAHPGVCPLAEFSLYNPDSARPWFQDLLPLDAAAARVLSQNVEYNDQVLYNPIITTGFTHADFRDGPNGINTLRTGPELGQAAPVAERLRPASTIGSERLVDALYSLLRIETRHPEVMQGGGVSDSARAMETSKSGPVATIEKQIWPAVKEGIPRLYTIGAIEEINLWPDVRRQVGVERRSKVNAAKVETGYVSYRGDDLRGFEHAIRIEPGLGLASYQDTVELMQKVQAKLCSRIEALERDPSVPEPARTARLIELDELRELDFAALSGLAANGQLAPDALSEVIRRVESGETRSDAIAALGREGRLLLPPPDPMAGMGGMPGGAPPGMPPEIAALGASMMGGATNPETMPLSAMRG